MVIYIHARTYMQVQNCRDIENCLRNTEESPLPSYRDKLLGEVEYLAKQVHSCVYIYTHTHIYIYIIFGGALYC